MEKRKRRNPSKGTLNTYGYCVKNTVEERRRALENAIEDCGVHTVFWKMNALMNFNISRPSLYKIYHRDRNYIKKAHPDDFHVNFRVSEKKVHKKIGRKKTPARI